jgi:hypothetical protein
MNLYQFIIYLLDHNYLGTVFGIFILFFLTILTVGATLEAVVNGIFKK